MNTPWMKELVMDADRPGYVPHTRETFVARYFPRYVEAYRPPTGIRLRSDGRSTRTTPGNVKAQHTKRDKIIDDAFASYNATLATVALYQVKREDSTP